ncbi:AAA family ATPase [Mycobacterium sp. 1245111.1]|uniref:ATP-binding protein n=1 Tax=Mycobacterium sp. 1245111.1 TaxID=1834073 RepID=UPI0009F47D36
MTFLFTDVEGSTRRWEADADAMRAALTAHDDTLRTAIDAHGGVLFKHTGDGVCAAFASPRAAVDAAVAAQRKLELPVRMGLATGEAELRDGDYFGAVLNRAARVMAAGHGGQILVADSTAGLVSGVALVDLGPRRLRDVPMPVKVFQVQAEGLLSEFPPLRALDTSSGNLRRASSSLIGRESDVAEVQAAVKAHRLVTLTGVGGVGKTRLAVEVADRLADEFPDGVWLFELATVTDPTAVPDAVAAILGISQQRGKSVTESVTDALQGRIRLLVIDNCEHVLDAAADLVEAILLHSANVKVLATSREGLGVAAEQIWRVPSLDVSAGIKSAAVQLFVERAQSVASDFSMAHPTEASAVVDICRRLDGIPLAVELAGSRMASMSASDVRNRLDQRFRLLVGSRRGLARHQTLRHAVAWSYDLLDDAEKSLLERCSVFAGGFDIESACAVSGFVDEDDYTILEVLDALVRKSLLAAERSAGQTRYSMLETIRQFAEEQLVAHEAATEARAAHARHFAAKEADIMALWDSPRQRDAYDWFGTELANLRTAFRWAADEDDLDAAAAIASLSGWLAVMLDNLEPVTWAEEIVEAVQAVDHPRLVSVCSIASLCYLLGRIDDSLAYNNVGRTAIERGIGGAPLGLHDLWLGAVYSAIGEPEQYANFYREHLARCQDVCGLTRACIVVSLANAGHGDEARSAASGMIEAAEATHNPYVISFSLLCYAMAWSAEDPHGALDALGRGQAIAEESGNRTVQTYLAMTRAMTLSRMEAGRTDPLVALDNIAQAIRTYSSADNVGQIRAALGLLVTFLARHEHYETAAVVAGFARVAPTAAGMVAEFRTAAAHLRHMLGDQTYESLARRGETMTTAEIANYAYDQIDRARTELSQHLALFHLLADDKGLDVVPAIAVGGLRDALLELCEKLSEETCGAGLALARERTEEERPSPCDHALHVFPCEHRGIVVPVGIVETEQLAAFEFEPGEAPAARLERSPELVESARPDRNDGRGDGGVANPIRAAPLGQQEVHVADDLVVEPGPARAWGGGGRDGGDKPSAWRQLHCAHPKQSLPISRCGVAPGAALVLVHLVGMAGEDRAGYGKVGGVGHPVHARPADGDMHRARWQAGRLVERDSGHGDNRRRRRNVIKRSSPARAVGLRHGVMGAHPGVGNAGTGLVRRRDENDLTLVGSRVEGVSQVPRGDAPRVRREIDERVEQRPAAAQRRETTDQAVGIHPIGRAQIGHAEHRFVRELLRGGQHGRMRRLEGRALRKSMLRIVIRHARELRAT